MVQTRQARAREDGSSKIPASRTWKRTSRDVAKPKPKLVKQLNSEAATEAAASIASDVSEVQKKCSMLIDTVNARGKCALQSGTLMRCPCARTTSGQFVAFVERKTMRVVVKVGAKRVKEMVGDKSFGGGQFVLGGTRTFREWYQLDADAPREQYAECVEEACAFVEGTSK